MATIVASKTTLTRFKITGDRGDIERHFASPRADIVRAAFKSIDDMPGLEGTSGLVRYSDYLSADFDLATIHKGALIACKLRIDERKIPGSLLKKEILLAERDYLKRKRDRVKSDGLTALRPGDSGSKKIIIAKDERAQLRESVKLRLMENTAPAPKIADVIISTKTGTLFLAESSKAFKNALDDAFGIAFPDLALEEITPSQMGNKLEIEINDGVGIDFLTHLFRRNPEDAFPGQEKFYGCIDGMVVLSSTANGKSEGITAKGSKEYGFIGVQAEVNAGAKVTKAQVTFTDNSGENWTMEVFGKDFRLGAFKTPAVTVSKDDASDTDTILMEKMHLVERGTMFLDEAFWAYVQNVYVLNRNEKKAA